MASGDITEDQAGATRTDYSSQADDNAIISGIEGSDGSFGWVGFAFAEGAGDAIKEIEVDGGDGCVGPSIETIADGVLPALAVAVHLRERRPRPRRTRLSPSTSTST